MELTEVTRSRAVVLLELSAGGAATATISTPQPPPPGSGCHRPCAEKKRLCRCRFLVFVLSLSWEIIVCFSQELSKPQSPVSTPGSRPAGA